MSIHDRGVANSRRVDIKLRNVVQHMEHEPADLHIGCRRKGTCPVRLVDVPAHHEGGSKLAKRIEHVGRPDVTSVDDEIRSLQRSNRLGPNEPVGVGDDADEDLACGHAIYVLARHCASINTCAVRVSASAGPSSPQVWLPA